MKINEYGTFKNEAEFQDAVVRLAHSKGLVVFHSTDARRDIGTGFPDLTVVGPGGVLFAELKMPGGDLRHNQTVWGYKLRHAKANYRLWLPKDLQAGDVERDFEFLADEPQYRTDLMN